MRSELSMGAKTSLLVFVNGDAVKILRNSPVLENEAARGIADRLYPDQTFSSIGENVLDDTFRPDERHLYIGSYRDLTIVCTSEASLYHPSQLSQEIRELVPAPEVYLHSMESSLDWFGYAVWSGGVLRRALSLSPEYGIIENIGQPLSFEAPYWAGERQQEDDSDDGPYPLPFHPLSLAEDALHGLLGFRLEGDIPSDSLDLTSLRVAGFVLT
jgi:uncharacterized protein DUF6928